MTGLFLLLIVGLWVLFLSWLTMKMIQPIKNIFVKTVIGLSLFCAFFVAPVLDEIIGGFQFRNVCKQGVKIIYDEEKVKNKIILWSESPKHKIENTILTIEESFTSWIDPDTSEVVLKYKEYYATGGWLSRTISFNSVTRPYTFNGVCGVKDELTQLQNKLNIERKYK